MHQEQSRYVLIIKDRNQPIICLLCELAAELVTQNHLPVEILELGKGYENLENSSTLAELAWFEAVDGLECFGYPCLIDRGARAVFYGLPAVEHIQVLGEIACPPK